MKRLLSLIMAVSICMGIYSAVPISASEQYDAEGIIIKYRDNALPSIHQHSIPGLNSGLSTLQSVERLERKDTTLELVEVSDLEMNRALEVLNADPAIEYAEPNYRVYPASTYVDPDTSYFLKDEMHLEEAWNITMGSEDVLVAVIDTGIDIDHEELVKNIYVNPGEKRDGKDSDGNGLVDDISGWNFVDNNSSLLNDLSDQHGTHVTGIIAAERDFMRISGVAPNVKVLPIKALTPDGGTEFDIMQAINYAEEMGADIVNCSFGSNYSSTNYNETIKNSDMLFVCAAGNDMQQKCLYPAALNYPNVISVGAMDHKTRSLTEYSNYGPLVEVAAQGLVYSTLPDDKYGNMQGTSMAAPIISGVAALIKSHYPDAEAPDIKERIIQAADESLGLDVKYGGNIDIPAALTSTVLPKIKRYGAGALTVGDTLYIAGGNDGTNDLHSLQIFTNGLLTNTIDLNTDASLHNVVLAAAEQKLYILGGSDGNMLCYTPATQTVTTVPMPAGAGITNVAAAGVGDKVYVFGGVDASGYTEAAFEYSPATNTWKEIQAFPHVAGYMTAQVHDGRIYIAGGKSQTGCLNTLYTYDPQSNSYETCASMYVSRGNAESILMDDKLLVIGGEATYSLYGIEDEQLENKVMTPAVEAYDFSTNTWMRYNQLDEEIFGFVPTVFNDAVYLLGGWKEGVDFYKKKLELCDKPRGLRIQKIQNDVYLSWMNIPGVEGYEVEIDGAAPIDVGDELSYVHTDIDPSQTHTYRIRFKAGGQYSAWSAAESVFRTEAQRLLFNEYGVCYVTGELSSDQDSAWYQVAEGRTGEMEIKLTSGKDTCAFAVYDYAGTLIGTSEGSEFYSFETGLSANDYFIHVYAI